MGGQFSPSPPYSHIVVFVNLDVNDFPTLTKGGFLETLTKGRSFFLVVSN